jgi:uncharacterized membrane protein HdeD (DUF308 family)
MPLGFILINAGILLIMYSANKRASDEWLMWGIVSAAIVTSGLGILGNAYVHKVKSDLIRKQKVKEQHSTVDER